MLGFFVDFLQVISRGQTNHRFILGQCSISSVDMRTQILSILEHLIGCDTQNPPREISPSHPIFETIERELPEGFSTKMTDFGNGSVTLFSRRGMPRLLFNVHVDTVPCGEGWQTDPLVATVKGNRVYGRGVCDIKGAAAALISAAKNCDSDFAILFSSDEEAGDSLCVKSFCESLFHEDFDMAVVAEPTECQAVLEHRGYVSACGRFTATAGHSSQTELLTQSATHRAVQWSAEALGSVETFEQIQLMGQSACFNLGTIQGGTKDNVIADHCEVTWSMRLPPMIDDSEIRGELLRTESHDAQWHITCYGPGCPASQTHRELAKSFCRALNISEGAPVDFWTEAAIFSHAGLPAIVLGPGHITQAHTIDEWVSIQQLEQAAAAYQKLAECTHHWQGPPSLPQES